MLKVAILVNIVPEGKSFPECVEQCQRQTGVIEAQEKYSFSIFMNTSGQEGFKNVWEQASNSPFDFYLLMDSDITLSERAISVFLENSEFLRHKSVITGTVDGPDRKLLSGGRTRHGRLVEPDPTIPVPCHLFDIAFVLIPNHVIMALHAPEEIFHRSIWDYSYGARVVRAGVTRVVAPGILARAPRRVDATAWKDSEIGAPGRILAFLRTSVQDILRVLRSTVR